MIVKIMDGWEVAGGWNKFILNPEQQEKKSQNKVMNSFATTIVLSKEDY